MSVIKKCPFPVAGYGTRFWLAAKVMAKEMLPIVTKPLIQHGVEEAMEAGITETSATSIVAASMHLSRLRITPTSCNLVSIS